MSDTYPTEPPIDLPSQPTSQPLSAAKRVYHIGEIRRQILRFLKPKDLASFIRVEKDCMAEVVKELYHTRAYQDAKRMGNDTERQKLYCAAVLVIDVDTSLITINSKEADHYDLAYEFKDDYDPEARISAWFATIETFDNKADRIVRPLREKFTSLRRVQVHNNCRGRWELGDWYGWAVEFVQPAPSSAPSQETVRGGLPDGWKITSVKLLAYPKEASVPRRLPLIHDGYRPPHPVIATFNLAIRCGRHRADAWIKLLVGNGADHRSVRHLHKSFDAKGLPLVFSDLARLYAKQAAAGYGFRLQVISTMICSASISEFEHFAKIASTSLTTLKLLEFGYKSRGRYYCSTAVLFSFGQLPLLISAIRAHLPSLVTFHMDMNQTKAPEMEAWPLLSPSTLEAGGTIETLRIRLLRSPPCPPLNTIRSLSPLVSSTASVTICYGIESEAELVALERLHSRYLRYLRDQPFHRRVHLPTVDFATIGIRDLPSALRLSYHNDGRPRHQVETEAIQWLEAEANANGPPLPPPSDLSPAGASSTALFGGSLSANTPEGLARISQLAESVGRARAVGAEITSRISSYCQEATELADELRRSADLAESEVQEQ